MFSSTKKKAFTLLELIVVIVILGILAALAIPSFSNVKNKAAEKTAISSAEGIVRDARALAAFDGAALADSYVDQAGAETAGYNAAANSLTVTSSGNTAVATIDPLTGAVSISGQPTGRPSFTVNATSFGWGSSNYYNGNWARWGGSTSVSTGWGGNQSALDALQALAIGDTVTFTLNGVSETHTVTGISGDPTGTYVSLEVTFDAPWTGAADTFNADPGTIDSPALGVVQIN